MLNSGKLTLSSRQFVDAAYQLGLKSEWRIDRRRSDGPSSFARGPDSSGTLLEKLHFYRTVLYQMET